MNTYYQEPYAQIIQGDCREVLAQLPANSVQCVVTSPPYWGLRKYAGEQELIWGDAWEGAYGIEPTIEMYIEHTIEILRAIRRVLRKDGVVFWNIGDSYFGSSGGAHDYREDKSLQHDIYDWEKPQSSGKHPVLKPKDLCLIPFRVAIAAQEDRWWVRSIIIWDKPNPMPESVKDRPTESHDYILMLTESDRYYWDADAVRKPYSPVTLAEVEQGYRGHATKDFIGAGAQDASEVKKRIIDGIRAKTYHYEGDEDRTGGVAFFRGTPNYRDSRGRNLRTVWEFPTQQSPGAHFAIFPDELPETCIKAATPEVGCCARCGAPWERITKPTEEYAKALEQARQAGDKWFPDITHNGYGKSRHATGGSAQYDTVGWQPTCNCNADKVPSIVLDPLAGTGTTGKVAKILGRKSILIDTSEKYCGMARDRITAIALPMIFPVEETHPEAPDWF